MIQVKAWGQEIGYLIEDKGIIKFKYEESNNLDLSPIKMPLSNKQVYNFSHLSYQYGLPGLISDHLPGSYGMDYMDRFIYEQLKRKPTVMERLQFLGSHTLGALEFFPSIYKTKEYKQILNVSKLYSESKRILAEEHKEKNDSQPTLKTLLAVSNSAGGGARSKAMVGFNPDDKSISLTRKQGNFPEGYYPVIIKYDDKDISMYPSLSHEYKDASVPTKLEYVYYLLAVKSGITMSPCDLLEHDGRFHFLTYRFDRKNKERYHMHSLSGIMHHNPAETYNDYMDLFRVAHKLNVSQANKEQMVKLILFNAIFGNRDDHTRNFSFLMNKEGKWAFSPAYDLIYTSNGYHQMLLGVNSLNRATFDQLKNAFGPFNIDSSFIKESIEMMISIKNEFLVKESNSLGIPESFTNQILSDTKTVDDIFTEGFKS